MRLVLRYSAVLVMAFSLLAVGACKSSAPLEDMPAAPAGPTPAPRVIEEEVVSEPVTDAMVTEAYVVDLETPVASVAKTMADRHFGSALVTRRGKLAGIFTMTDACRVLADQLSIDSNEPDEAA